jgi:hypothetical protein
VFDAASVAPAIRARASDEMIRPAHRGSSAPDAGRQTKMRRRLGVSPEPVGFSGPAIENISMWGRPVQSSVSYELRRYG